MLLFIVCSWYYTKLQGEGWRVVKCRIARYWQRPRASYQGHKGNTSQRADFHPGQVLVGYFGVISLLFGVGVVSRVLYKLPILSSTV